ncbi:MAG TPA: hypothetical protein VJM11_05315 [Nevskiaceae bacterium]|nr:hypothetical protein [Nevskiaceae bacterium]
MKIRMVACLAAGLVATAAGTALAGEPVASQPTSAAAPAPAAESAEPAIDSRYCLTATGTRIPPKDGECVPAAPGRVITREEMQRSGATSAGDAVRRLTVR